MYKDWEIFEFSKRFQNAQIPKSLECLSIYQGTTQTAKLPPQVDDHNCTCVWNSRTDFNISGQHYQEKRKQKRERKQPSTIPDLPYLHWERTGAPPAGPYNALETRDLDEVDSLKKPDFMSNPHKFFGEKLEEAAPVSIKLPALSECEWCNVISRGFINLLWWYEHGYDLCEWNQSLTCGCIADHWYTCGCYWKGQCIGIQTLASLFPNQNFPFQLGVMATEKAGSIGSFTLGRKVCSQESNCPGYAQK